MKRRSILSKAPIALASSGLATSSVVGQQSKETYVTTQDGLQTDPEEIRDAYADVYNQSVAGKIVEIWKRVMKQVENSSLTYDQGFELFIDKIAEVDTELQAQLDPQQTDVRQTPTAGDEFTTSAGTDIDSASVQATSDNDTIDLVINKGGTNKDGVIGVADAETNVGKNELTIFGLTPGAGNITFSAWLGGVFYVNDGNGTYEFDMNYFHAGGAFGGSALYEIWVKEQGEDSERREVLGSYSTNVFGEEEQTETFELANNTAYEMGVQVTGNLSGLLKGEVDYQTVNIDPFTPILNDKYDDILHRKFQLNSVEISPLY